MAPFYHNKGLRRALTTVERGTHKEFTRFTDREILCSTRILDLHLCVCVWGGNEYVPKHRPYLMFVVVIFLIPTKEMLGVYLDQDATASYQIRSA